MLEQDVIDDVDMDEEREEEGEEGPVFTEEELSEELQRYRNIVLSACSSLGNLQPVAPKTETGATDTGTQKTAETVEGSAGPDKTPAQPAQEPIKMEYVPSSECLASLKDIKRYIQMDEQGDGKLVLQWLGEWSVLRSDIIPIFKLSVKKLMSDSANEAAGQERLSESDRDYLLKTIMMCVELFVFLTWSMESEPEEVYTRFIRILRSYKSMFAEGDVISSMMAVVVMYVRKNHNTSRESMLIKGILYVLRNILAIPDPLVSPTSHGLTTIEVQDRLIAVLEKEMAVDFFLALMSSADQPRFKDLRPTLLDIIYYLFYRVPPSALFASPQAWFKRSGPSTRIGRHNHFGGIYAVSTGDGIVMPVFSAKEALQPFANL
ncbi:Topoisomerase 1-associated factor 1, partial [Linderina macrospora]